MAESKVLSEYFNRFSNLLNRSLLGLTIDEQLVVTTVIRKVIPLFVEHAEGYYDKFYEIYEKEILNVLRHKARELYHSQIFDYLDQDSWKFDDMMKELKLSVISDGKQVLEDEEYSLFIETVTRSIMTRHEILLVAEPKQEAKKQLNQKLSPEKSLGEAPEDQHEIEAHGDREEYMDIGQLAKFLDCTKATIHEYKNKGMPFYRIGRTVKFKLSEVLNFMRQQDRRRKKGRFND